MRRPGLTSLIFVTIIVTSVVFAPQIEARTTQLDLSFNLNNLRFEKRGDFDQVFLEDLSFLGQPGEPMLPVQVIRLVIPADQRIESVRILNKDVRILPETYQIFPIQPEFPLSRMPWIDKKIEFIPPDPQVYASTSEFPGKLVEVISYGFMAGHHIAALAVYPLQYLPKEGRLSFLQQIELELTYQPSDKRPLSFSRRSKRTTRIYSDAVKRMVINPEEVSSTLPSALSSSQATDVEYLIITPASFASSFQPLADWKTAKGIPAEIYTVEWVTSNYSGLDTQEQIRNFIRDMYQNNGTVWVLLGGDVDYVPYRKTFAFTSDGNWNDTIPADLYYSDLDSNWDADGDGVYGEISDAVDMYPDIFVGRFPVDNVSQVFYFINKTLEYEITPPTDYMLNILLTGEILWGTPYTPGGDLKDYIDAAYIPGRFDSTITKLYQNLGNLNYNSFRSALNSGQNIVNHYGHGDVSGFSIGPNWWSSSSMSALTNAPRHSVLYTISCLSAAFDFSDCCGENFINNTNGGGVAYFGNSRYGWGSPGNPTQGSGPKLDKRFFQELFVYNTYQAGKTLSDAKAYYVSSAQSNQYLRWTLYALNLLGDPELPIWTDAPQAPVITYPRRILTGSQNMEVKVENGETPVEQALICLNHNPDIYLRESTSEEGIATFNFEASDTGEICIVVTAKDYLPHQDTIQVINYFVGDANADTEVTVADVVFVINYLFNSGEAPDPVERGDADCSTEVTITDAVYLVNYLFRGGSEPCS